MYGIKSQLADPVFQCKVALEKDDIEEATTILSKQKDYQKSGCLACICEYYLKKKKYDSALSMVEATEEAYRGNTCQQLVKYCLDNTAPICAINATRLSSSIHSKKRLYHLIIDYYLGTKDLMSAVKFVKFIDLEQKDDECELLVNYCLNGYNPIQALKVIRQVVTHIEDPMPQCYQKLFEYYMKRHLIEEAYEISDTHNVADALKCLRLLLKYHLRHNDINKAEEIFRIMLFKYASKICDGHHDDCLKEIFAWYVRNGDLDVIRAAIENPDEDVKTMVRKYSTSDDYEMEICTKSFPVSGNIPKKTRTISAKKESALWLKHMLAIYIYARVEVTVTITDDVFNISFKKWWSKSYWPGAGAGRDALGQSLWRLLNRQRRVATQTVNVSGRGNITIAYQRVTGTRGLGAGIAVAAGIGTAGYLYNQERERQFQAELARQTNFPALPTRESQQSQVTNTEAASSSAGLSSVPRSSPR